MFLFTTYFAEYSQTKGKKNSYRYLSRYRKSSWQELNTEKIPRRSNDVTLMGKTYCLLVTEIDSDPLKCSLRHNMQILFLLMSVIIVQYCLSFFNLNILDFHCLVLVWDLINRETKEGLFCKCILYFFPEVTSHDLILMSLGSLMNVWL